MSVVVPLYFKERGIEGGELRKNNEIGYSMFKKQAVLPFKRFTD